MTAHATSKRPWTEVAFPVLVLGLSTIAFATNPASGHFAATMSATGNAGGTVTSVGAGGTGGEMCPGYPVGRTSATSTGGSVGLTVSPSPGDVNCAANRLPKGRYLVSFYNGPAYGVFADGTYASGIDGVSTCRHRTSFKGAPVALTSLGTLNVDGQGFGSGGPYLLPENLIPDPPDRASEICIAHSGGSSSTAHAGTSAPVVIVE